MKHSVSKRPGPKWPGQKRSGSQCPGSQRSALILLAHGSRHNHVTHALRDITDAVARQSRIAGRFGVHMAFLDHAEPDLVQVSARLAELGYDRAVVVPLLFTDAFHSRVDVPAQVKEAQNVSGLAMSIARGLGTGGDLAAVLEQRFSQLVPEEANSLATTPAPVIRVLYSVGSSDPVANDAVSRLAASIGAASVAATGEHPKGVAAIDHIITHHGETINGDPHHGGTDHGGPDEGPRKKDRSVTELGASFVDPLVVVQPLFVAPGKLWAMATKEIAHRQGKFESPGPDWPHTRVTYSRGDTPQARGHSHATLGLSGARFRCGSPLGVDLAPMIAERACSV